MKRTDQSVLRYSDVSIAFLWAIVVIAYAAYEYAVLPDNALFVYTEQVNSFYASELTAMNSGLFLSVLLLPIVIVVAIGITVRSLNQRKTRAA